MTGRRRALADRRKAAGYSQERLAEAIRVEPSTVERWERGETEPQPWFRPKLARALGISNQALGDLLGESAASETAAAAGPTCEHGEAPHRDDLFNQSMADAAFPALDLDELQHLAAALTNAGRYLDSDVVSSFKRQLDICATDDGAHGPARTLPVVLGVVAAIERNARLVKPDVRRALLAVGAQGAEFVGWLYRQWPCIKVLCEPSTCANLLQEPSKGSLRQGHWALPRCPAAAPVCASAHWRDRAIEWAQEADEWPMQGYVLLKKSQAAWDGRDGLRMLTLAQAAHNGPWELPPLVRAEVAQQEARGLAMIGEAGSVDAKLDEAWRVLCVYSTRCRQFQVSWAATTTVCSSPCRPPFVTAKPGSQAAPPSCTARASTTSDSRTATAATSCR